MKKSKTKKRKNSGFGILKGLGSFKREKDRAIGQLDK